MAHGPHDRDGRFGGIAAYADLFEREAAKAARFGRCISAQNGGIPAKLNRLRFFQHK
jgi:hypothetical protein